MDLSLLFYFAPSLSESRKTIARRVRFGDWTSVSRHSAFPRRRHHQVVRLVPLDGRTKKRFLSITGNSVRGLSVFGISDTGLQIPLNWACASQRGVDYAVAKSAPPIVALRLVGKSEFAVDVQWVCAAQVAK